MFSLRPNQSEEVFNFDVKIRHFLLSFYEDSLLKENPAFNRRRFLILTQDSE